MPAGETLDLETAYDAYADRLHDYAVTLLPGASVQQAPHVVRGALESAFAEGSRAGRLRGLRPLLYASVRSACLRLESPSTVPGRRVRLDAPTPEDRLCATVAAMASDRREIYELACRHGLPLAEVAEIAGGSVGETDAQLAAVLDQLGRSHHPTGGSDLLALAPLVAAPGDLRGEVVGSAVPPPEEPRLPVYQISPGAHAAEAAQTHRRKRPPVASWALGATAAALCAGMILSRLGGDDLARPVPDLGPTQPVLPTQKASLSLSPLPSPSPTAHASPTGTARAPASAASSTGTTSTTSGSLQSGPTGRPGRKPTPPSPTGPTSQPQPTQDPTTPAPPPVVGLVVSSTSLDLNRTGEGSTGEVVLRATGAPVTWTATTTGDSARWLQVSETSGSLAAGEQQDVDIVVDAETPPGVDTLEVHFGPGDLVVTVNVS